MLKVILNMYMYNVVLTYRQPSKDTINMYRKLYKPSNNDAASEDGLKGRNM
jgi:hypothetical protein